jgi:RES domain-containing protein
VDSAKDGLKSIEAVFFRCTSRKREPLSTGGALRNCGRYNVIGCAALYLASSPNLAVSEHLHLRKVFEVRQFPPRLLVSVEVSLTQVLDLTDESTRGRFALTLEDLTGPYSADPDSPSITQTIAMEARKSGIEAILAPSALVRTETNLVVFRDNVASPRAVRVVGFDDHVSDAAPDAG